MASPTKHLTLESPEKRPRDAATPELGRHFASRVPPRTGVAARCTYGLREYSGGERLRTPETGEIYPQRTRQRGYGFMTRLCRRPG